MAFFKKSSERPANTKNHVKGVGAGSGAGSKSSAQNKKGRQTNNSMSSVLDPAVLHRLENGAVKAAARAASKAAKSRRPPLSAKSDEVRIGMYKILEQIKNHPDAWPFLDPVDEDFAPDYYTKISQPMDLEKMEQRLSSKYYHTFDEFVADFDLIIDNCKTYNGKESGESFLRLHLWWHFYLFAHLISLFRKISNKFSGAYNFLWNSIGMACTLRMTLYRLSTFRTIKHCFLFLAEYSFMVDSLTEEFRMLVSRFLGPMCPPQLLPSGSESDATSISDVEEE